MPETTIKAGYESHCPVCGGKIKVGMPLARRTAFSLAAESQAILWGHINCRPPIASKLAMLRWQAAFNEGIPLSISIHVNERPIFTKPKDEKGRKQGRQNVTVFYNSLTYKALLINSMGEVYVPTHSGWQLISHEDALILAKSIV